MFSNFSIFRVCFGPRTCQGTYSLCQQSMHLILEAKINKVLKLTPGVSLLKVSILISNGLNLSLNSSTRTILQQYLPTSCFYIFLYLCAVSSGEITKYIKIGTFYRRPCLWPVHSARSQPPACLHRE